MTLFGSPFIFLNPWMLSLLAALPALWYLLRITPPVPQRITLPTARFLAGLISDHQTPNKTPWWILLLRLLVAALIIIALAHPVHNPKGALQSSGPVRLIIDNGWAAAQTWNDQMKAARDIVSRAGRENNDIYIIGTALPAGGNEPVSHGPLTETQADAILKAMKPVPWPADYKALADYIESGPVRDAYNYWLSHGLSEGKFNRLSEILQRRGGLSYYAPKPQNLPVILMPPQQQISTDLSITVQTPESVNTPRSVRVQARGENGQILDQQAANLGPEKTAASVTFDLPDALRGQVSRIQIAGHNGAGTTYILDERYKKRSVGIIGPADQSRLKPFIEAEYYLSRAAEPFAALHYGDYEAVLAAEPSMIILPDIGAIPPQYLDALEDWVRSGGLLLRFAGPNMTQNLNNDILVPAPLRSSGRALDGAMTWETPAKLQSFPETSPLYGIEIPEEITVRQQILAEPSVDLEEKTWAGLEDGTPLITGAPLDKGLLVMVHTTASPAWSDLALSGTYVEILQRLVMISGTAQSTAFKTDGMVKPHLVMDGFGALQKPDSAVKTIPAAEFQKTPAGPSHPPGLYESGNLVMAKNIGDHIQSLKTPTDIPLSVTQQTYGQNYERDFLPHILFAALCLLLADWLVMALIALNLRMFSRFAGIAALALFFAQPVQAQSYDQALIYADGLHLAYVQTGNVNLDATSRKGLENLGRVLSRRTSVEPQGVAAVNPERDELAFFPLLYWPVDQAQHTLSAQALNNIQAYLDQGGTILFDTRDQNYSGGGLAGTQNAQKLKALIGGLNIPPLSPIPDGHVLSKSFYLLDRFPGRHSGGTLWVEKTGDIEGRDGVSSVIIGNHDWAGAWAAASDNRSVFSAGSRQQELALRFGVNLMLYTLTGNYKADQVHVPHILERLGQ